MRLFVLSIFLLVFLRTNAQLKVEGYVMDLQNEPLVGATIRFLDKTIGTITDTQGYFNLDLPSEQQLPVNIEARFIGFKPSQIQIDHINQPIKFMLEENALGLNELIVTGSYQPTFIKDSPVKVDVITSGYLNTYLPAPSSGLIQNIAMTNGVQEVVSCGVCYTNNISINGLPGQYTAILMDGTPIYGNLASVYGLNGISNLIIDRIEIIKGPNSTLYGSEAMAGVINIITKRPEDQPMAAVDLMYTNHHESFGNLATSWKAGNNAYGMLGINFAHNQHFEDENQDGFGDIINMDRLSIFNKWQLEFKGDNKLSIAAKLLYEDRRNGVESFLVNDSYKSLRGSSEIYGESIYTYRAEVFGTYESSIEGLSIDYSWSNHRQDSYYGADQYLADQQIVFSNVRYNRLIGNHGVTLGMTQRWQLYDDNTVATEQMVAGNLENRPDHQYIPGVFAQDEWRLSPALNLLLGTRIDHYESHGLITSPRVNAKWSPNDWNKFRFNFGTGFKIVNLFTEDHAFVTGQREVIITEQIKPERSINYGLNYNLIFNLWNSQGSLDVDTYFTRFSNKIYPDYSQSGYIIYDNSDGQAISKGISMSVNQDFNIPLQMTIAGTIASVTESTPEGRRWVEYAPRWTSMFNANYQLKKWSTKIAYSSNYIGKMALPEVFDIMQNGEISEVPRPVFSAPFSLHNIQITKQFGEFALYMGINNLLGYTPDYSPLVGFNDPNSLPGFSPNFDTSYAYAPLEGREFFVGFNWSVKR